MESQMTNEASSAVAGEARKEAILEAVRLGCPRWMAAAAGDMTRVELREALEEDEDFARRMEIARGKAGVHAITSLWEAKEKDKDIKVLMWLLENLILPRRTAAGSKAQGRRGQGDGEEAEDRVGLGTQRLLEALERLGIQCTPPVDHAPGGPDGGAPQAGPAVAGGVR
jgi:hypothetical protein